ncbi:DoxX family protein [Paenibacillus sp. P26]|nr:DoxX family protein [Paenibacillus sp. P26]UUZ90954.1 DoxX family protein [Paenibacillus sp. P25]
MKWVVRILQGLLALGFLLFGFMKLSGNPDQVKAFTEIFKYGLGSMYLVGAVEVLSAIGLIIGYWKPKAVLAASGALVIVMLGAVGTHLIAGQGMGVAMMPLILLILALVVFLGKRSLLKN